jgi:type I restriction enzyme M protein
MPNDLFDVEHAPNNLDIRIIENAIDCDIKTLEEKLEKLEKIETKTVKDEQKTNQTIIELDYLKDEKSSLISSLKDIYNDNGVLKDKDRYYIENLKSLFSNKYLQAYRSNDILLRNENNLVLLDYIRDGVLWD